MAKTNFKKVEESLDSGLRQMDVNKLLDITKSGDLEQIHKRKQLLLLLKYEIKSYQRQGKNLYIELNIDKLALKQFIENPDKLTQQDVEKIKKWKEDIERFKIEYEKKNPSTQNDSIIEKERRKHINKRFNINDDWLPLR